MLTKKLGVLAMTGALVLSLSACASADPGPQPTATPTPVKPSGDGILRIGDLTPLTGDLAPFAGAQTAGIELAAREVNELGGFKDAPIEVLHRNAGDGDPATTEANFNDLVSKGVDVIIAPAAPSVTEQLETLVKSSKANVAVVSLITQENAPEEVTIKLTTPDEAFSARLKQSDPTITELGFGAESYDLAIATILAAVAMKDDGGASIAQGLIEVSNREGFLCTSYGMCTTALTDKQKIDYKGVAGVLNYDPVTSVAYFTAK